VWTITVASHAKYFTPPSREQLDAALADATARWTNSGGNGDNDVSVNVRFELPEGAEMDTFPFAYYADEYNDIVDEEKVVELLAATAPLDDWILFVKSTPFNFARARSPGRRIVMPDVWNLQGSLYAHELGHNAGLPDRDEGSGGLVCIMKSIPGLLDRQMARSKERDAILNWNP
jgi:hypothetical protein